MNIENFLVFELCQCGFERLDGRGFLCPVEPVALVGQQPILDQGMGFVGHQDTAGIRVGFEPPRFNH